MIRRPPRSTQSRSSAASDVYKRQHKNISMQTCLQAWDAIPTDASQPGKGAANPCRETQTTRRNTSPHIHAAADPRVETQILHGCANPIGARKCPGVASLHCFLCVVSLCGFCATCLPPAALSCATAVRHFQTELPCVVPRIVSLAVLCPVSLPALLSISLRCCPAMFPSMNIRPLVLRVVCVCCCAAPLALCTPPVPTPPHTSAPPPLLALAHVAANTHASSMLAWKGGWVIRLNTR